MPPTYYKCLQSTTESQAELYQKSFLFNLPKLSEHYLPFFAICNYSFSKDLKFNLSKFLVTLQHIFAQRYPNQFQSLVACHYSKLLNFLMQLDKTHCAATLQNFTLLLTSLFYSQNNTFQLTKLQAKSTQITF